MKRKHFVGGKKDASVNQEVLNEREKKSFTPSTENRDNMDVLEALHVWQHDTKLLEKVEKTYETIKNGRVLLQPFIHDTGLGGKIQDLDGSTLKGKHGLQFYNYWRVLAKGKNLEFGDLEVGDFIQLDDQLFERQMTDVSHPSGNVRDPDNPYHTVMSNDPLFRLRPYMFYMDPFEEKSREDALREIMFLVPSLNISTVYAS